MEKCKIDAKLKTERKLKSHTECWIGRRKWRKNQHHITQYHRQLLLYTLYEIWIAEGINMRWSNIFLYVYSVNIYEWFIHTYLSNKFKKQVKEVEIVLYFSLYCTQPIPILFYIKLAGLQNEKSREVKSDSIRSSNVMYVF